jgi:hypothetical protein
MIPNGIYADRTTHSKAPGLVSESQFVIPEHRVTNGDTTYPHTPSETSSSAKKIRQIDTIQG